MEVFYITLIGVFILAIIARLRPNSKGQANVLFYILVTAIITIVAGLRRNIGDTYYYVHTYTLIGPGFEAEGYEPGFMLLLEILKSISDNPQLMIFVTALIANIFMIWAIRKYSKDSYFELGIFLYITSGFYLFTMNGIRQSIACSIVMLGIPFIIKGNFKMYLPIVLLAMTFHESAFIMIPIFFIVRTEAWSKTTFFILGLTIIGMFLYEPIIQFLANVIGGKFAGYVQSDNQEGANVLRVAIQAVPVVLAYLKRDELKKKWPESNIFVNLTILALIVMFFSMFNWVFGRFKAYMQPAVFIILPYIIKNCLPSKERRLVYYGLLICYFIYFWYDQAITMNIVYKTDFVFENIFYNLLE